MLSTFQHWFAQPLSNGTIMTIAIIFGVAALARSGR
jgi:hypothetical protein